MSEQSKDAAERSAHVTRGPAVDAASLHPVKEWKTPEGKTVGQLRVVAELRAENERLRALLRRALECLPDCYQSLSFEVRAALHRSSA